MMRFLPRTRQFALRVCFGLCLCWLGGCGYSPARFTTDITAPDIRLESARNVYITRPPVPAAFAEAVAAFGLPVQTAVVEAFKPYVGEIATAQSIETRLPALAAARAAKARYLIIPSLYRTLTDRALLLPGDGFTLELFFSVFDVSTGEHLLMRFIRVYNGRAAPGEDPSLLVWGLDEEVAPLFGRKPRSRDEILLK